MDLQLVRLLRAAMNTTVGGGTGTCGVPCAANTTIERRFRVEPETKIEPRKRVEPTPHIEPRQVIRPADRYEPAQTIATDLPADPGCYKPKCSPIQPPWKVLPWHDNQSSEARPVMPKIKVEIKPPDIAHKGSLIDFFM